MIRKRSGWMSIAAVAALASTATWSTASIVSYSTVGGTYSQNFDTLPNSGGNAIGLGAGPLAVPSQSTMPTAAQFTSDPIGYTPLQGWYFAEPQHGNTGFTQQAGAGATASLNFFSSGAASSSERALGVGATNNRSPWVGVILQNTTGETLTEFSLSYWGEQWQQNTNSATLGFSYLITGSDSPANLTATGTGVAALNFTALHTGDSGALDGNLSNNRTFISHTVTDISWADGDYLWLRWSRSGLNASAGLALDDMTFTAIPEPGTLALVVMGGLLMLPRRRQQAAVC
jgi:hypothetical protein